MISSQFAVQIHTIATNDTATALKSFLPRQGKPRVGADQIHVGNAPARPYRLQAFREPTLPIDDRTDHWQTACGRMDFGVAMLEDERHRESHRLGEMNRSGRCPN